MKITVFESHTESIAILGCFYDNAIHINDLGDMQYEYIAFIKYRLAKLDGTNGKVCVGEPLVSKFLPRQLGESRPQQHKINLHWIDHPIFCPFGNNIRLGKH